MLVDMVCVVGVCHYTASLTFPLLIFFPLYVLGSELVAKPLEVSVNTSLFLLVLPLPLFPGPAPTAHTCIYDRTRVISSFTSAQLVSLVVPSSEHVLSARSAWPFCDRSIAGGGTEGEGREGRRDEGEGGEEEEEEEEEHDIIARLHQINRCPAIFLFIDLAIILPSDVRVADP